MEHVGINLQGTRIVHLQDGSVAPNPAKIEAGSEPGTIVLTNEQGKTSGTPFITPTVIWAADYVLYGFALDSGNTIMRRHNNICRVRQSQQNTPMRCG